MRTYNREMYERANLSWEGFGAVWNPLRQIAYERGYPVAPKGEASDDWDDEFPSQRAIIWRALVDRPVETLGFARRSRSWYQVVDLVLGSEERLRSEAAERARDDDWERKDEPDPREATVSLKRIVDRIAQS